VILYAVIEISMYSVFNLLSYQGSQYLHGEGKPKRIFGGALIGV